MIPPPPAWQERFQRGIIHTACFCSTLLALHFASSSFHARPLLVGIIYAHAPLADLHLHYAPEQSGTQQLRQANGRMTRPSSVRTTTTKNISITARRQHRLWWSFFVKKIAKNMFRPDHAKSLSRREQQMDREKGRHSRFSHLSRHSFWCDQV